MIESDQMVQTPLWRLGDTLPKVTSSYTTSSAGSSVSSIPANQFFARFKRERERPRAQAPDEPVDSLGGGKARGPETVGRSFE